MNDSYKYSTLPRNFRRSSTAQEQEQTIGQETNQYATQRSVTNKYMIDSMTLPGRQPSRKLLNDSFERGSPNNTLTRNSVGSDSEILDDRTYNSPDKIKYNTLTLKPKRPTAPFNSPALDRKNSFTSRPSYRPAVTPRQSAARIKAARVIELKYNSNFETNNQRRIDLSYQEHFTSDSESSVEML